MRAIFAGGIFEIHYKPDEDLIMANTFVDACRSWIQEHKDNNKLQPTRCIDGGKHRVKCTYGVMYTTEFRCVKCEFYWVHDQTILRPLD